MRKYKVNDKQPIMKNNSVKPITNTFIISTFIFFTPTIKIVARRGLVKQINEKHIDISEK